MSHTLGFGYAPLNWLLKHNHIHWVGANFSPAKNQMNKLQDFSYTPAWLLSHQASNPYSKLAEEMRRVGGSSLSYLSSCKAVFLPKKAWKADTRGLNVGNDGEREASPVALCPMAWRSFPMHHDTPMAARTLPSRINACLCLSKIHGSRLGNSCSHLLGT